MHHSSDQGVTAEESVLKAQVCGKENMLLRDRNDLNSDPDDLIAGSSWVLQHPRLRILRDSAEDFRITPPRDQTITDSSLRGLFPDRDDHPLMLTKGKRLRGLQDATLIGCLDFQCHGFGSRSCGVRWWLRQARRHDSTWQGPAWESVPCVVGHGRIIRPQVRTSVGPGRPSERRGRVAGRELAARPAVDPGGGRATVPCVPGVPGTPYLTTWANSGKSGRARREQGGERGQPRYLCARKWVAPFALFRSGASACSRGLATNRASATAGAGRRYRLYGLSDHGEELF